MSPCTATFPIIPQYPSKIAIRFNSFLYKVNDFFEEFLIDNYCNFCEIKILNINDIETSTLFFNIHLLKREYQVKQTINDILEVIFDEFKYTNTPYYKENTGILFKDYQGQPLKLFKNGKLTDLYEERVISDIGNIDKIVYKEVEPRSNYPSQFTQGIHIMNSYGTFNFNGVIV